MTTTFVRGDMFATPGLTAFAHGCNCAGVMGAGIAEQFSRRWPAMYREYTTLCRRGQFHLGYVYPWRGDGYTIFNLATQQRPGPNADLDAVRRSVTNMLEMARTLGIRRIGMPLIGTGIGGLQPAQVRRALMEVAGQHPVELLVFSEYVPGRPAEAAG